jgi:signal transduction histidine kinase/ligand-binding sensor domain-containing protein/DNA-binding response OmpR family regulator
VVYDAATNSFQHAGYSSDASNPLDGGIYSIVIDRKGVVWVGTEHNGIKTYDVAGNRFVDVNQMIDIPNVRKTKFLSFEDRQGDMWFGIQFKGLYHKISSALPFHTLGSSKRQEQMLSHFIVKSILRDRNGNLWVGTDGGGLNVKWNGRSDFSSFQFANQGVILTDKAIISLYEDHRGWIWIGTYLEGLFCYKANENLLVKYKMPGADRENWNNYIFNIREDASGNLWIATNGGGLFYLRVKDGGVIDYTSPQVAGKVEAIKPFVNALAFDADSTLWIGTYNGLFCWNANQDTFRSFSVNGGDLANDIIFSIVKDGQNRIWFGTLAGLYCYNPGNNKLVRFTTDNGLCDNNVMAIEIDQSNNLWISTTAGISKLNPENSVFQNYYVYDGLPCNEFRPGSSFKDLEGTIYFGGTDGLVFFNPDSIKTNPAKSNLIFTRFKIFNQEVKCNPLDAGAVLQRDVNEVDTIALDYSFQSFTLEFAAINFTVPEKIKYAVQLEGFSPRWDFKDYKQRYASYTNLNPGTYFLNVKSTNPDGQWNNPPRRLCIIVRPPFWSTWRAFIVYMVVLISIIYFIRKIALFRIDMKNQLRLEHVERERLEEMDAAKMQFFTNISHEIRTPLTMLLAPIDKLINSNPTEDQKKNLHYIYRNTKRIERIVNQILELQKLENTPLKPQMCEIDLGQFLQSIISLFEAAASDKQVQLLFEPHCDELKVWIDPEKMDHVIFNLLSNALKFSAPDGCITVSMQIQHQQPGDGNFMIAIADNGKGMDQKYLDRIFDRFYQINGDEKEQTIGTGIGLHLSKELIELQHGTLTVESRPGAGSTFFITMPLGSSHLLPEEISQQPKFAMTSAFNNDFTKVSDNQDVVDTDLAEGNLILIIEDDNDILHYLEDELSENYRIIIANNGADGWKLAFEKTPDLIVSDIMMPGMNGLDLCKRVKSTVETSHIPVILLTAKTSVEHEIEGLETGADDYMHKPFHPQLLRLKIDKAIERRLLLKQQFNKNVNFVAKEMTLTSADEKFLQRAYDFVKNNLSDADLNMEKMSNELSISRVHLYRKLKALTNQNPTEFIRTIRLKQAAYLLSQGKLNISEIAYMVGFNSHQYFSNSFQRYFNMSPTEYLKKNEQ